MSNQPETNETAAPVQGRKVGLPRFFELMGRDLWPLYKSSFLCVLGFLPGTVLAVLGMMGHSALLTVVGGVLAGLVGGPFLSCMMDTVLRALRDELEEDLPQPCGGKDLAEILVADPTVLAEHTAEITAGEEDAARAVRAAEHGLFPEVQHRAGDNEPRGHAADAACFLRRALRIAATGTDLAAHQSPVP